ncbi:MAG: hypothetical protein OXC80_09425 [Gammaproteobacteria bacterium]|nr:hypothetical protein [Gammaproteobacteria bacterium]
MPNVRTNASNLLNPAKKRPTFDDPAVEISLTRQPYLIHIHQMHFVHGKIEQIGFFTQTLSSEM